MKQEKENGSTNLLNKRYEKKKKRLTGNSEGRNAEGKEKKKKRRRIKRRKMNELWMQKRKEIRGNSKGWSRDMNGSGGGNTKEEDDIVSKGKRKTDY